MHVSRQIAANRVQTVSSRMLSSQKETANGTLHLHQTKKKNERTKPGQRKIALTLKLASRSFLMKAHKSQISCQGTPLGQHSALGEFHFCNVAKDIFCVPPGNYLPNQNPILGPCSTLLPSHSRCAKNETIFETILRSVHKFTASVALPKMPAWRNISLNAKISLVHARNAATSFA